MGEDFFIEIRSDISKVIKEDLNGNFIPASTKDYPPFETEPFDYEQQLDEANFNGEENALCVNFEEQGKLIYDLPLYEKPAYELKYFIDGTFRTYYWGDFEVGKILCPVILGETVVSIITRENKNFHKIDVDKKINIVLPPIETREISEIKEKLSKRLERYDLIRIATVEKDMAAADIRGDIRTAMLGKVRAMLHEDERENAIKIQHAKNEIVVIDGDLRSELFTRMENFIGVAKSFSSKPIIIMPNSYEYLPMVLRHLKKRQRTCILTKKNEPQYKFWYVRLRNPEECDNYLQGIVKIEINRRDVKKATNEFVDFVNQISLLIFKERLPSSYPIRRWTSHIYPIYIAEKLGKSCLTPTLAFRQLFKID